MTANPKANDPTPAEIAERCAQIQATWSPDERQRRLRVDLRPMVATADGRVVSVAASDYDRHHITRDEITAESVT